jgi:protocatechuate 3,4-dioxygenase beta subunit
MKIILISFILLGKSISLLAQTADSLSLLNEASTKLKNGTAVSTILTDKKYVPVHPATYFREEIKKYSTADILKITATDEPGKKIKVLGTITDKEGNAVAGALIYLYQTDAKGWYAADAPHVVGAGSDAGHARIFGYVKTDANGKFELHTVKPSGYPRSDLPAHIHVHVWAGGYHRFVNEFLFDDDERLVGKIREQSIRNDFMISKPEKTTAPFDQQFSYTITLDKE